jgi:hypothetical protein
MTKSAQVWTVFGLWVALGLLIAAHGLLVEVDFHTCFENYANSISPGTPRLKYVGEMSVFELVDAASSTASADDAFLLGIGLLTLFPYLLATLLSKTPESASRWTMLAVIVSILAVAGYAQSLWSLFGGAKEFYDCDLNGVSIAIALGPILLFLVNLAIALALGLGHWLSRRFSSTG